MPTKIAAIYIYRYENRGGATKMEINRRSSYLILIDGRYNGQVIER
jgi:hypothetical protein